MNGAVPSDTNLNTFAAIIAMVQFELIDTGVMCH